MRRLIRLAIAVALVLGLGMGTGFIDPHNPTDAITRYLSVLSPASADAPPPTTDPVDAAHVQALLRTASVVPTMNEEPGYQRSCRKGKGCVFGPAWTDDSDAALSHNGCDTRNDILRSQLTHVLLDPKTRGCTVLSGVLDPDPYTGAVLQFRKGTTSSDIEIDHVFPLEAAWHAGAHDWPLAKRVTFANDPANLLAAALKSTTRDHPARPDEAKPVRNRPAKGNGPSEAATQGATGEASPTVAGAGEKGKRPPRNRGRKAGGDAAQGKAGDPTAAAHVARIDA